MSANEDLLNDVKRAQEKVNGNVTNVAVQAFMASIGISKRPSPDELRMAMIAAQTKMHEAIFCSDTLGCLSDTAFSDQHIASTKLLFRVFAPPLNCPPLPTSTETPPLRLSVAAMLGAILGLLVGSTIGLYFLNMRDAGILVGAPLGAFLVTWSLELASRSVWASRTIMGVLGIATFAELWILLSVNPLTTVWQKMSGSRTSLKRIGIYLLVIGLIAFTRRRVTFDRAAVEIAIRQTIESWLFSALVVLAVLNERRTATARRSDDAIPELGKRIKELYLASPDKLAGIAEEVVDAAREAGFEGLCREDPLVSQNEDLHWSDAMGERFDTFGYIESGDRIRVEREPVIRDGEILEKGLVRKKRGN